ncbi:sulfatase-like hydrolase/transferase [Wenyingzhuangia sp. IMCC45574]
MFLVKNTHLKLVAFLLLTLVGCSKAKQEPTKPNIVLIQVDDLGFDDLSINGNPDIETPNIDKLGKESTRFNNFYLSSLCAPSRASLLTGRNFLKAGVSGVHGGKDYINLKETLLPQVLKTGGYTTGMWGKWHSGKTNGYFPWDRGFDEAYYACLYNYFDNEGLLNGKHIKTKGYTTDKITDMAIDFVTKNKNTPFFAYMSHLAPHNPWRAPQSYIDKYTNKGLSKPMATLYGMIDNLDYNVGRLIDTIDTLGLGENTIILFVSDNGPWVKSYRFGLNEEEWKRRNPNGRKGKKGTNWENGIKSPLFVRWKGKINHADVNEIIRTEDIFPTLVEMAEIQQPEKLQLDGISFAKVFKGESIKNRTVVAAHPTPIGASSFKNKVDKNSASIPLTQDYISTFGYKNQRLSIRKGDFKYVLNETGEHGLLYNIKKDYKELHAIKNDSIKKTLDAELKAWYKGVLESKHAYQMPELQIGYKNRRFNQIYACTPSKVSEHLMNADHFLANWTQKGDAASYKLNVHTPGTYTVHLIHKIKNYTDCKFKITNAKSSCQSFLMDAGNRDFGTLLANESAYWEDFDLKETFKKDIIKSTLGTIELKKGKSDLTVLLEDVKPNHNSDIYDQIIAIHLVRE